jgi:CDP-3, 6-dideoxy-D-glycero-L-glycero-4-hexulose-4-reductase
MADRHPDIVLTGGTGFIGGHLRRHFGDAGQEVVEIRRQHVLRGDSRVEHSGDVDRLTALLEGLHRPVLVHLATHFVSNHTADDLGRMIEANLVFPSLLYEAFFRAGGRHVVVAGSAWQYDAQGNTAPANLYAAQKVAALAPLDHYLRAHDGRATQVVLFDTYGPGDQRRKLLPALLHAARSGSTLTVSAGAQPINLTHVEDVCRGIEQAVRNTLSMTSPGRIDAAIKSQDEMPVAGLLDLITTDIAPDLKLARDETRKVTAPKALNTSIPPVANWCPQIPLRDGLSNYFKGSPQ